MASIDVDKWVLEEARWQCEAGWSETASEACPPQEEACEARAPKHSSEWHPRPAIGSVAVQQEVVVSGASSSRGGDIFEQVPREPNTP